MRLTDLEPSFRRCESRMMDVEKVVGDPLKWRSGDPIQIVHESVEVSMIVDTLAEAQEIWFLCPSCFRRLNGSRGCHTVAVGFHGRGLTDSQSSHNKSGQPVRWQVSGTGFHDLTLSPSIDLAEPGEWHGHIVNGEATFC